MFGLSGAKSGHWLGPCWGYLGFYGGLGVERKNLQPKKMFYAGLGGERKKPPTKENVVDVFLEAT